MTASFPRIAEIGFTAANAVGWVSPKGVTHRSHLRMTMVGGALRAYPPYDADVADQFEQNPV